MGAVVDRGRSTDQSGSREELVEIKVITVLRANCQAVVRATRDLLESQSFVRNYVSY